MVGYKNSPLKCGYAKKIWHLVGWNAKGNSPSKLANVLVKKIVMLTFLVANQSSP